jgi:HPr kinase/phosphorylase
LSEARELVHGTCVALGRRGALLRGRPGSGKSDLALRFVALPGDGELQPILVADDQVIVESGDNGVLLASSPETIAGKIEVRGLGIGAVPFQAQAALVLVCDLVNAKDVPRMPPEPWERTEIAGRSVPVLKLAPFEPSAPLKLKMALLSAAPDNPN